MRHVLAVTSCYPGGIAPLHGLAIAQSLKSLANMPWAGMESATDAQSPSSRSHRWRVTAFDPRVITPLAFTAGRNREPSDERGEDGPIDVHRPRIVVAAERGTRRHAAAITRGILPLVQRIHARTPITLIAGHGLNPEAPVATALAKALDVPVSIRVRGRDLANQTTANGDFRGALTMISRADGVLATCEAVRMRLIAHGITDRHILVHHTGLDRNRFRSLDHTRLRAQLSAELGFAMPDTSPLLTCVGTLEPRKGQDIVIAALDHVDGARLVVVGSGADERRLRDLAAARGVTERVHFAGTLSHDVLPLVLSAADVMVLPRAGEGLANAWIEALACGTPVVACDGGGAREVIANDTAGRLVAREPEAVAVGINAILNQPPLRREVAALAAQFSWDRHARELAAHYDGLLAGRE